MVFIARYIPEFPSFTKALCSKRCSWMGLMEVDLEAKLSKSSDNSVSLNLVRVSSLAMGAPLS